MLSYFYVYFITIPIFCLIHLCYNSFMNKIEKMIINLDYVDSFLAKNYSYVKCLNGCNACCYDYFYVSLPEFYLTLYGLRQMPFNLDFFYNKANKTYDHFNKHYNNEIKRLQFNSESLLESVVNDFEEGEYVNYQSLPECIFLNNGKCSIYKYRPNTCRKYGTTITCELIENEDLQDNDEVNYKLFPLIENTQLVNSNQLLTKTHRYPLWFLYSYFLKPEFRPFVISNLNKMLDLDEESFINQM